jgi:arachidonate 15-lipoxygenase
MHDEFSADWILKVADLVMISLANMAELELCDDHREFHLMKHKLLRKIMTQGECVIKGVKPIVEDAIKFNVKIGSHCVRPESLDDYIDLFHTIGLPPVAKDATTDAVFARMRVGGPNSVMIHQMPEPDERFPVTDSHFQETCPNDSLDAAFAEGRVYLCDYSLLASATAGNYPHGQKYVHAPLAMFVLDSETRRLKPVAIQCDQKPGAKNPIITPTCDWNWLLAKTAVEMADGNIHEAVTHLGRTHLFRDPFAVTTHRQLAPNHPLFKLLTPHFEGTLAINQAAWQHLIANKGPVEKLMSVSIRSAREACIPGVQTYEFNSAFLPKTFAARGVADAEHFPDYPYRDDSILYWQAIRNWTKAYIDLYYSDDQSVLDDVELQNWYREMASKEGGRIAGLGIDNAIPTVEYLADALTMVIFTCSVQHAAVNFPQYQLMSYVPNMPLAMYKPAPTSREGATEQDYLDSLPPMDMAELQMDLGYLLGSTHYTQLGQYRRGPFRDPAVGDPLSKFQHELTAIGATIRQRNQIRRPYTFLDAAGVPQSINIGFASICGERRTIQDSSSTRNTI